MLKRKNQKRNRLRKLKRQKSTKRQLIKSRQLRRPRRNLKSHLNEDKQDKMPTLSRKYLCKKKPNLRKK